jgi:DeoR/GlpR family transcriptional regulator of sugar metabolism
MQILAQRKGRPFMLNAERRQRILEKLRSAGQVSVSGLAIEWEVSEDSIRRDLRDLAEDGLVQRVHGGALPASPAVGDYQRRESLGTEVKARLGRAAAGLVRPGQVVGIDGGTTCLQLVRAFPRDLRCTVVTHSPLVAAELRDHRLVEVLMVGGRLFRHSQVCLGAETLEAVGRIRLDLYFLGATGLRLDTGATTGDWDDAAVKRAFCRQAAEVVLPVSPEKWGAASAFQIVPAPDLGTIILPAEVPESEGEPFRARGISVVRA